MIDISSIDIEESPEKKEQCYSIARYTEPVSYSKFFTNHLIPNIPCIFSDWITEDWLARKEWVDGNGDPNLNNLRDKFGDAIVPCTDCNKKYYNSHEKHETSFKSYLQYFEGVTTNPCLYSECLYLKDWHFKKAFKEYKAYTTPIYFASDWLNEFWEHRDDSDDDYRFVYMGPKGSWTPFHADVFRSFSWSANMCGRKRWLMFPPDENKNLRDSLGNLPYDITDLNETKLYSQKKLLSRGIDIVQEKGEIIFIPSNWHHQVWNEDSTISINHNWINGANISHVVDFFLQSLNEVEHSISDCSEMEGFENQCQLILKATHGMDVVELFTFIIYISSKRLEASYEKIPLFSIDSFTFGKNHVKFDILKLIWCLQTLLDRLPPQVIKLVEHLNPEVILDKLLKCI